MAAAKNALRIARSLGRSSRASGGGTNDELNGIHEKWKNKGVDLYAHHSGSDYLNLSKVVVPKEQRGQGLGHQVMNDLTGYADRNRKTMTLSPDTSFGGSSVGRLKSFYKGHGFVENSGKNKDFGTRESMLRPLRPARASGGSVTVTHEGPINSAVAGRTDHLKLTIPSGSYIIPADIVSAYGEGNTPAGFKIMRRLFGGAPYGGKGGPYNSGQRPYGSNSDEPYGQSDSPYNEEIQNRARGGEASHVPVIVAGGEYSIHPEDVLRLGGGDMKRGHRILDEFVLRSRRELIDTLKMLPGPAKS